MRVNLLLVGVGGQGLIKLSEIIARATTKKMLPVWVYQQKGMAQRGGSVRCEVRIGEVESSAIPKGLADIILTLELSEVLNTIDWLSERSLALINTKQIPPINPLKGKGKRYPKKEEIHNLFKQEGAKAIFVDAAKLAEKAGLPIAANMVMLGALASLPQINELMDKEIFSAALVESLSKEVEKNLEAFELGFNFGKTLERV
jgi:indolepyruvate ferredoxin oxidoreductase beta subunit